MTAKSDFEVYLEGGDYLFSLHPDMPILSKNDDLVHTDQNDGVTTYKVKSVTFYCGEYSAPTEGGVQTAWRPPVIKYTVNEVV